jgi:hypothetical protein
MRFLMVRGLRALAHERPAGAIARHQVGDLRTTPLASRYFG